MLEKEIKLKGIWRFLPLLILEAICLLIWWVSQSHAAGFDRIVITDRLIINLSVILPWWTDLLFANLCLALLYWIWEYFGLEQYFQRKSSLVWWLLGTVPAAWFLYQSHSLVDGSGLYDLVSLLAAFFLVFLIIIFFLSLIFGLAAGLMGDGRREGLAAGTSIFGFLFYTVGSGLCLGYLIPISLYHGFLYGLILIMFIALIMILVESVILAFDKAMVMFRV